MPSVKNIGKPYAGKPHVRLDEGGQARACSLLYPLNCDPIELVAQADIYIVNADGRGTAALANSTDFECFVGITPGGRVAGG